MFRGLIISQVVFKTRCIVSACAGVVSMCVVVRFRNLSSRGILNNFVVVGVGGLLSGLGTWRGRIRSHHQIVRWISQSRGGNPSKRGGKH